ncbi:MAG: phosphoribosyl-ATP diphosphatase [Anaerosomatales bacterium]|nr:phosphoribosyl-ATP diphosphatase [Anaerosomatales bacterium]
MDHTAGPLGEPTVPAAPSIGEVLEEVFAVLEQRKREMPEDSYTAKLLLGPQDKLLKKIAEESGEVIIAARDRDAGQLRYEIGDLLYHLLVVMVREGLTLDDLAAEMADRRRK